MSKSLYIAEKPMVAREFARVLSVNGQTHDGYIEGEDSIFTWCVGHLVTMSYPDAYDEKYKKWRLETLPFLPNEYKYQVIDNVKKQFGIVSHLLTRDDVDKIYVCTDSGREGEYIYRLVEQEAHVTGKKRYRVWIDSQTEEEIKRGIKEAKDLSEYDNLADAAYLRAKEDYLMGINFSRALTLRYGNDMARFLNEKYTVVSVGRVMTCVLGMVVNREREIRAFDKTPFYRVLSTCILDRDKPSVSFDMEWKAVAGTKYFETPSLYKENGFKKEEDAKQLIDFVLSNSSEQPLVKAVIEEAGRKQEKKNPPLLYNLAEIQNDCSKLFKISPADTLRIIQELYEKKLVTYPRTDARVLSTAVAKEISKNLSGLRNYPIAKEFAEEILNNGLYKNIVKSRYTNDKAITDHYAIIPTGQGLSSLSSLSQLSQKVYEVIVHRFLAIFYGPAMYQKLSLSCKTESNEQFFAGFKVMTDEGFMKATKYSFIKAKGTASDGKEEASDKEKEENEEEQGVNPELLSMLKNIKKGSEISLSDLRIKEGETTPPKRYNTGSMILAMENAGQLIEDEELRAQIKGSGIGTSATRAEILEKLSNIKYLNKNNKTQVLTPTMLGEMVYEAVSCSIPPMLDPKLTASWEKGLDMVSKGEVSKDEYMEKLNNYVGNRTNYVKGLKDTRNMNGRYSYVSQFYKNNKK